MDNTNVKQKCISIVSTRHGRWSYFQIAVYSTQVSAEGCLLWKKNFVVVEVTTFAKAQRLAKTESIDSGYKLLPHVRHNQEVRVQDVE